MNLILTKECAKKCSFCFTGDYSKSTEMSLEFIEKIIKQFNNDDTHFRLLGGEPTQHNQFSEILKLLGKYNVSYNIISNLLFDKSTLKAIINSKNRFILCNGMELDQKNRIKKFKENWNTLRENNVSSKLAITLDNYSTKEYFEEYIKFLVQELQYIPLIRIGYDLSGKYLINNKNMGIIVDLIHKISPLSEISFDCQVPLCTLNKYIPNDYRDNNINCQGIPLDIFYDGSAIHCYPASNIKIKDIFKYKSILEIQKAMRLQYKKLENNIKIPIECSNCNHYLFDRCKSLCLGCYQDEKQYIDIKNIT